MFINPPRAATPTLSVYSLAPTAIALASLATPFIACVPPAYGKYQLNHPGGGGGGSGRRRFGTSSTVNPFAATATFVVVKCLELVWDVFCSSSRVGSGWPRERDSIIPGPHPPCTLHVVRNAASGRPPINSGSLARGENS